MRWGWKPYVPVAKRRQQAKKRAESMAKNGRELRPVTIEGRKIAETFWGKAWCENLESYSDFANRLPRGRTYVRNGSVVDLRIEVGGVEALVSGSELYTVKIDIEPVSAAQWKKIRQECAHSVDSLMDLLQGRFSQGVMERLTRQKEGLFPQPREIKINCSCPDYATMCKHAAAVLYGVGARLDVDPVLLFQLRKVDHLELIREAVDGANLDAALADNNDNVLAGEDLGALFGIDLSTNDDVDQPNPKAGVKKKSTRKRAVAAAPVPEAPVAGPTGRGKKVVKAKAGAPARAVKSAIPTVKKSATTNATAQKVTAKSRVSPRAPSVEQPAGPPPVRKQTVPRKSTAASSR